MTRDVPPDENRLQRFEEHRLGGGDAPLDDFLPGESDPSYVSTLEELVAMDLEIRWKAYAADAAATDDPPSLSAYRERFPTLSNAGIADRLEKEDAWLRQRFAGHAVVGPGSRVGRYTLVRRVGRGAFASVWRARDEELRRDVAIKVPRVELGTDVTMLARIMREARSAGQLRHPSIVPVHEVVELEGRPCIVSEFVDGPTLSATMAERAFAPDEAATLVAQLADALAYAHENGVVHRDVKPGNVLLEAGGRPVLTDFGLAQVGSADATLTQHGEVLGTPAYMSPEQARGDRASVDGRSDVYSLGAVLYELLTRSRPFHDASTAALLYAVVHQDPLRPRSSDRRIPPDLETVCMTAMAKERDRRYASAAEMAADLRRYLDRRPIAARRPGPLGRALLWVRRRPAVAATLAVSLIVLAAVTTVAFYRVVAARDRAEQNLYRSLLREAEAEIVAHETGWRGRARRALRHASELDTPDRDVVELRSLLLRCELSPHPSFELEATLLAAGPSPAAIALSGDGSLIVYADRDHDLVVFDAAGAEIGRERVDDDVTALAVDPGGAAFLVGTRSGELRLVDPGRLATPLWSSGPGIPVHRIAWAADGGIVAVGREDGAVEIYRMHGRAPPHAAGQLAGGESPLSSLAVTADGTRVAVGTEDAWVRVRNWATGETTAAVSLPHRAQALAFDASERYVAVAVEQHLGASIWDTTDRFEGLASTSAAVHQRDVVRVGFDLRGRLVTASLDGSAGLFTRKGEQLGGAREAFPAIVAADFDGAGSALALAYRDGSVRLWRVVEGIVADRRSGQHAASFVPGTRRLVASDLRSYDYSGGFPATVTSPTFWSIVSLHAHGAGAALVVQEHGAVELVDPRASRFERALWASAGRDVTCSGRVAPDGPLAVGADVGSVVVFAGDATGRRIAEHVLDVGPVRAVSPIGDAGAVVVLTPRGALRARPGNDVEWFDEIPAPGRGGAFALAGSEAGVAWVGAGGGVWIVDDAASRPRKVYEVPGGGELLVSWSRDGSLLALGDERGRLHLVSPADADAGPATVVELFSAPVGELSVGPYGEFVIAGSGQAHVLVDAASATPVGLLAPYLTRHTTWTADGAVWRASQVRRQVVALEREVLLAKRDEALESAFSPGRIGFEVETAIHGDSNRDVAWGLDVSGDGRYVATAGHTGAVQLWDAATLAPSRELIGEGEIAWCVAFSPDSRSVAAGSGGEVVLFDVASGEETGRVTCGETLVVGTDWHASGELLATATLGGGVTIWDPRDGRHVVDLAAEPGLSFHSLAFSPDGARLAAARDDGAVLVWEMESVRTRGAAGPPRVLPSHPSSAWAVAWDPGGRYLASGGERGGVMLREADTLETLVRLRHFTNQVRDLAFDDDTQFLAVETYHLPAATWDLDAIRDRLREFGLDW